MFMQPVVETAARRRVKLDDAIGPWFAVLGIGLDPAHHITDESLAWWRSLGARLCRIDRSRSGPGPRVAGARTSLDDGGGSLVLEDVDGAFRDWLLARPGEEVIVLRPDRYVAAVCDRQGLESTTQALRGLLADEGRYAGAR
jgi:3-(3-hydroxy-phenyl)propionate hydroxylase